MNLLVLASIGVAVLSPNPTGFLGSNGSPGSVPPDLQAQTALQLKVNAKTGDTIGGIHEFRVTVDSSEAINQVEFYVGEELRDTETSTPYTFPLDTVDEPDGDIRVRFKAYTVENKTAEKTLTLHIDNAKSKGADFHVNAGQDQLTDSHFKEAITEGRIALKINSQSVGAKIVLARANLGLHVLDQAQKYAEDATAQDPKSDVALQILAAVDVQRAFSTFAREDSDRADVVVNIGEALQGAVEAARKSLDLEVDALGPVTDANALKFADAAILAERYSLAISTLQHRVESDSDNLKLVNRLAYAQLRSGRYQDALNTLNLSMTKGTLDAYGNAVLAVLLLQVGKTEDANKAMKNAIEADPDNLGVRTAQALFALKQNKTDVLSGIAADLAKDQGQRVTVNYFLTAVLNRQQKYSDARKAFRKAVLAQPSYPDLYIEQADNALASGFMTKVDPAEKERSLALAKMYYQTALIARPESSNALAGMAVLSLMQNDRVNAVKFGEASRDASPDSGVGHFVLSAAYEAAGRSTEAHLELDKAGQRDPVNLAGRAIPNAVTVWKYLVTGGRIPVISPPQG